MDNLFEQITMISKAGAYEVVAQHRNELIEENKNLRETLDWISKEITTTPDELSDALLGLIKIKIRQALNSK